MISGSDTPSEKLFLTTLFYQKTEIVANGILPIFTAAQQGLKIEHLAEALVVIWEKKFIFIGEGGYLFLTTVIRSYGAISGHNKVSMPKAPTTLLTWVATSIQKQTPLAFRLLNTLAMTIICILL